MLVLLMLRFMPKIGLFVGLMTLDVIYQVKQFPQPNEKIVALDYQSSAGGPATNAAIAFSAFNPENQARIVGILGNHSNSNLIRTELEKYGVILRDLDPSFSSSPPLSSVIVTQATGDRAVISLNAQKAQATRDQLPDNILENVAFVLIDGHQMAISEAIAKQAKTRQIPVIIDGGSWKQNFDKILPYVDYALCSANFYPPDCHTSKDVFYYLNSFHIPSIAITQGQNPILYQHQKTSGKIAVPPVPLVDTLGAGDIFHGSFCHWIQTHDFETALTLAAKVASHSCQFFGTRHWITEPLTLD